MMFVIGIYPHKRSHTAAVLDDFEELVGQLRVNADRWQRDRLLRFAAPFVYGIGPWAAAVIVGHTGDVTRFPSGGHYARYNATAPLEASSGPRVRHRLNPRRNRQLNDALHVGAITQVSHGTDARAFFLRKIDEGKTRKEAVRALKRRLSDAVYRQLLADTRP